MQMRGNLLLLLTAFIWGTTFVAQMRGLDDLGPFTYSMARYFLGVLFLALVLLATRGARGQKKTAGKYLSGYRAGLASGILLFIASSMQQVAMVYTTAGKTAFITALYIVLVPLGAALFRLGRVYLVNWLGALLALAGLYLLTLQGALELNLGDLIVFVSAFFWTAQILFIDRFAAKCDSIELSLAQTSVCLVLSAVVAFLWEEPAFSPILTSWISIAYAGVLSTGIAYTLQIVGQKYASPSEAAVIMSFEAVFGAVSGALLLGEDMSAAQVMGCTLMFAGIIVSQLRTILKKR